MNNVWTVAFKTPCTGLRTSSARSLSCLIGLTTPPPQQVCTRNTQTLSRPLVGTRKEPRNLKSRSCRVTTSRGDAGHSFRIAWGYRRQLASEQLGRKAFSTRTSLLVSGSQEKDRPDLEPVLSTKNAPSPKQGASRSTSDQELKFPPNSPAAKATAQVVKSTEDSNSAQRPVQATLTTSEVANIVGSELTFDQGFRLIQDIQNRRVTGSLAEEGLEFPDRPEVKDQQALAALSWLRNTYPMDEEAAAAEWAEEEAARLEAEYTRKAEDLWLYKRDKELDDPPEIQSHDKRGLYGQSVLEQRIKARQAEEEAKEKQAEDARTKENRPPEPYRGHDLIVGRKAELSEARERKYERWDRFRAAAELPTEQILADRSAFSRLWAPYLLGLTAIAILVVFAESYDPPSRSERWFPDIPPAWITCGAITLINFAVFLAWRRPELGRFMNKYFLMSAGHPRAISILGNLISHQAPSHLAMNTGFLVLFGISLHSELTRGPFISLYLSSGIIGALTTLTYAVLTKDMLLASVGASGALYGLLGAHCTIHMWYKMGFQEWSLQYPGLLPLLIILAWELRGFWKTRNLTKATGGVDYLSHIGGLVSGAGAGYLIRYRAEGNVKALERSKFEDDVFTAHDTSSPEDNKGQRHGVERVN